MEGNGGEEEAARGSYRPRSRRCLCKESSTPTQQGLQVGLHFRGLLAGASQAAEGRQLAHQSSDKAPFLHQGSEAPQFLALLLSEDGRLCPIAVLWGAIGWLATARPPGLPQLLF